MEPTDAIAKATRKRLVALTGYLSALFVVAASVAAYRLDAEALRQDAQALIYLQRFNRFLEQNSPDALLLPLRTSARQELARTHDDLDRAHVAQRDLLTRWLIIGLQGNAPTGCNYFAREVVEGKRASLQREPTIQFSFMQLKSSFLAAPSGSTALTERGTVDYLVKRLDAFFAPVEAEVVRKLDLEDIADPCVSPSMFESPAIRGMQPEPGPLVEELVDTAKWRPPLREVQYENGKVIARYAGMEPGQQHVQQQMREDVSLAVVRAVTQTVTLGSSADLLADGASRPLVNDLRPLFADAAVKERITRDYGFLPIDYAVSTAGASLVQGYAGTSFFGIRVTTQRLALVVACAGLLFVVVIAAECRWAAQRRVMLFDEAPEGVIARSLTLVPGRIFFWCFLPAASILMAASLNFPYAAAAAVAAAIGLFAVHQSIALYRAAPA